MNVKKVLSLLLFITVFPSVSISETEREVVRIGVLAFRTPEQTAERWTPTVARLAQAIPEYDFVLSPMTYPELNPAVTNKTIDFVLTNTGHYVELEANENISRMVTLVKSIDGFTTKQFGGVFFTKADRADINSLSDLKGKDFLAVKRSSLGGFLVAWEQLLEQGMDPFSDFASLTFNGLPQDDIVFKVLNGEADAGTVRTSVLEQMEKEGTIQLDDFKIINQKHIQGFPFIHSTNLYPEWPFSSLSHVDQELVKKVTVALLTIKNNNPAAIAGDYDKWVPLTDYQSVHDLFIRLNIGPYQNFDTFTFMDVIKKYWVEVLISVLILCVILIFVAKIVQLNVSLKKALSEVETLQGFIPICSSCKKIRDDKGYWNQVESYISKQHDAKFSHGFCPECYDVELTRIEEWSKKNKTEHEHS